MPSKIELGMTWNRIVDAKTNRRPVEEAIINLTELLAQNPKLLEKIIQDHKNVHGQGK